MKTNRRNFIIGSIGTAIIAGITPKFVPGLIDGKSSTAHGLPAFNATYMVRNNGVGTVYLGAKGMDKDLQRDGLTLRPGEEILLPASGPQFLHDPKDRGGIVWQGETGLTPATSPQTLAMMKAGTISSKVFDVQTYELEDLGMSPTDPHIGNLPSNKPADTGFQPKDKFIFS
jgi:hypothetical protein